MCDTKKLSKKDKVILQLEGLWVGGHYLRYDVRYKELGWIIEDLINYDTGKALTVADYKLKEEILNMLRYSNDGDFELDDDPVVWGFKENI